MLNNKEQTISGDAFYVRFIILSFSVLTFIMAPALAQNADSLTLIGSYVIPSGLEIQGIEFGGISGLDYNPETAKFVAICDDRSQKAPARFYDLDINLSEDGIVGIDIIAYHTLKNPDGNPWAEKAVDPEGIALSWDYHAIYYSSERDQQGRPGLYKADLSGKFLEQIALPEQYIPSTSHARGVYNNLAFEGLTFSTDRQHLFAATENALVQDGPKATLEHGSPVRILTLDLSSGKVIAEYIYITDPIPVKALNNGWNDNGLTEILSLSDGSFLVAERAFAAGIGFNIRLYHVNFKGATNVLGKSSINGLDVTPVNKERVMIIENDDLGIKYIDNIEAMSFGPEIDKHKTLILVSDNNFNIKQETQFYAFGFR